MTGARGQVLSDHSATASHVNEESNARRYTEVMRLLTVVLLAAVLSGSVAAAQRKPARPVPRRPAAAPPAALKTMTPEVRCPSLIGMGIKTVRSFCDVPAGRDPMQGIVVTLPPHTGPATLTFDVHARHLYSEDEMGRGTAYAR